MRKVKAILNWKGKLGYVILSATLVGLFAAYGSRLNPIDKEAYELERSKIVENTSKLDTISKKVQTNIPVIEEFKQSEEFLSGE